MTMKCKHQQQGAVLIVSLLILLVLTVIGVSGLSGTGLEERMSHNFQHGMLAFQGVESANESIIEIGNSGRDGYLDTSDPLVTAASAGTGDTSTVVTQDMDPNDFLGGATLATSTTISFQGTSGDLCAGEGEGTTCYRFVLTTTATIAETGTSTTHIQGIEVVRADAGT